MSCEQYSLTAVTQLFAKRKETKFHVNWNKKEKYIKNIGGKFGKDILWRKGPANVLVQQVSFTTLQRSKYNDIQSVQYKVFQN